MPTVDVRLTPAAAEWSCDGRPVAAPIPLDAAATRGLRDLAHRFLALFEQGRRPFHGPADLRLLGRALFDPVFAPAWAAVQAALEAGPRLLLLCCAEPDLLNLPWELVELHPDLPLGCDPAWGLLRVPAETPAPPPDPGSLRLLFLAAAPAGQVPLDFEREEDAMLKATGRREAGIRLVALSCAIAQAIGLSEARQAMNDLMSMCAEVGHEEKQMAELLQCVVEAHARDRGRQLLLDAFPKLKDTFPA